ncbi:DNA-binding protein D-ETS-6, partial [Eumeta japonica]
SDKSARGRGPRPAAVVRARCCAPAYAYVTYAQSACAVTVTCLVALPQVHGKRYAYRFDWAGLVAACQAQAPEPPPYWRYLPPRAPPTRRAAGAAAARSRPETSERLRSDSATARADSAITAMTLK